MILRLLNNLSLVFKNSKNKKGRHSAFQFYYKFFDTLYIDHREINPFQDIKVSIISYDKLS